jgi:hypothetical protein
MRESEIKSIIFQLLSENGIGHPEELKWLRAVNQIFDNAKKENPSYIYRSEVESLIIGLRSNATSEEGRKVLQSLMTLQKRLKDSSKNRLKLNKDTDIKEEKEPLYEGVSVFVPNQDKRRLNTILDLCFFLNDKVLSPIHSKQFTQEEKENFQKSGLRGETFAPDGDSFDLPTGTINFYISGIPNRLMKTFLEGIKYHLTDEGIQLGPFRGPEQSKIYKSQVIRIPITKNVEQDLPPDLSMTYSTAQVVFQDLLGFNTDLGGEDSEITVSAKELLMKVEMVEDNDFKIKQVTQEPSSEHGSGGVKIIHGGLSEEWVRNILKTLKEISQWAIDHDYTDVAVT